MECYACEKELKESEQCNFRGKTLHEDCMVGTIQEFRNSIKSSSKPKIIQIVDRIQSVSAEGVLG